MRYYCFIIPFCEIISLTHTMKSSLLMYHLWLNHMRNLSCTQIAKPHCNIVDFNYTNIYLDINEFLSYYSDENID